MANIDEIRNEINACDVEIARLLNKRMGYVEEIIEIKREQSLPIFQPKQEAKQKEILETIYRGCEYEEENEAVFKTITTMSKKVQAKKLLPYNIALIGFMGAGKSTVSSYLHELLALDLVETDKLIVEQQGMSINDIFAKYGEPYFRNLESNVCIQMMDHKLTVISCGGGLVMRDENVENLKKSSRIVLLTASPETIYERVKDSTDRPLLNGHMNTEYISELMEKRRPKYEAAADFIINTDGKSVREICEELIRVIH